MHRVAMILFLCCAEFLMFARQPRHTRNALQEDRVKRQGAKDACQRFRFFRLFSKNSKNYWSICLLDSLVCNIDFDFLSLSNTCGLRVRLDDFPVRF